MYRLKCRLNVFTQTVVIVVRGARPRSGSRMEASPLLEGGEETRIQNVFLRLPSAEPVCQQQGGQLFVAMPAAKAPQSEGRIAVEHIGSVVATCSGSLSEGAEPRCSGCCTGMSGAVGRAQSEAPGADPRTP
ncbi:hypothetical protein EYF80_023635 [Liparis tanakae]|uniref:Uncharacterized protein n=1 Tax=Liparis tanakae TaxID=230148 RepID=A0A4Z2HK57_9TELE|nr:hypothetical protein EYF80_023635 [Liparis tanakae]